MKDTARNSQPGPTYRLELGKTYANRDGAYEVVAINPPKMTIRYTDGRELSADIALLERIWDNMQSEATPPAPEPRGTATRRAAAGTRRPAEKRTTK